MKVNILFEIKENVLGGGNQFLKLLKKKFIEMGIYADLADAEIVLFNSHQNMEVVIDAKYRYPDKIFIHRVDGPIRLYNHMKDKRDNIVNSTNRYIADGTIFQSIWSKNKNYELGLPKGLFETIICNCADEDYFNMRNWTSQMAINRKIKLIATSWSNNIKKGFRVYKYLDEHLDWNRYEMIFVGNSPIDFDNIKVISPVCSKELAELLKQNDIYISASQCDPCSNSVIEALSCGLPALCFNDGGHPELVKRGGRLFNHKEEIPGLLEAIVKDYEQFHNQIEVFSSDEVAQKYYDFFLDIYNADKAGKISTKKISAIKAMILKQLVRYWSK